MHTAFENEDWLLRAANEVARKRFLHPEIKLSDWEHLVACVFDAFFRKHTQFVGHLRLKAEGLYYAQRLGLKETTAAFSVSETQFPEVIGSRLDSICAELQNICEHSCCSQDHSLAEVALT